jgi:putative membrane protein
MQENWQERTVLAFNLGWISGIICAITKFGWEIPFPPRTPLRDLTNPPQQFLQQIGFTYHFSHLTYFYNGNPRPTMSLLVHFGFSIVFAILYCYLAEFYPKVRLWQGAAYGLVVWFAFHVVLLPMMGTVPPPWQQPAAEHFSEITGHMFCFWVTDLARHDLKMRFSRIPEHESVYGTESL